MESITIVVDPSFDLAQNGRCNCDQCCDRFYTAYCDAAKIVEEEEEIEITVERGSYSTCGEQDDPANIWQKIHDEVDWIDHDDIEGKNTVDSWDTVATYTSTYPDGDTDGWCTAKVQIGQGEYGYWYARTCDDAGGGDDAPDSPLHAACRAEAVEWAEAFASEMDEWTIRMHSPTSEQIREARLRAGLTQEQAGALVGAPSRRTWQNWETGRRNMPEAKWELFQRKVHAGEVGAEYKVHLNSERGAVQATEIRYSDTERGIKQIAGRAMKTWAMEAIFFRRLGFDEFGRPGYDRITF